MFASLTSAFNNNVKLELSIDKHLTRHDGRKYIGRFSGVVYDESKKRLLLYDAYVGVLISSHPEHDMFDVISTLDRQESRETRSMAMCPELGICFALQADHFIRAIGLQDGNLAFSIQFPAISARSPFISEPIITGLAVHKCVLYIADQNVGAVFQIDVGSHQRRSSIFRQLRSACEGCAIDSIHRRLYVAVPRMVLGIDVDTGACVMLCQHSSMPNPKLLAIDESRGVLYILGDHGLIAFSNTGKYLFHKSEMDLGYKEALKFNATGFCVANHCLVVTNGWSSDVHVLDVRE